jgi:uncharacterized membrane protein YqiK
MTADLLPPLLSLPAEMAIIGGLVLAMLFCGLGIFLVFRQCFRRIGTEQALIIYSMNIKPRVVIGRGAIVLPILNRADVLDLSLIPLRLDLQGNHSAICADNIRIDVAAVAVLRIQRDPEAVLTVITAVGARRATDPATLRELFVALFTMALRTVAKQRDASAILADVPGFAQAVQEQIGTQLNGYAIERFSIEQAAQTQLSFYSRDNILDAIGIRKIVEATAAARMAANIAHVTAEKVILRDRVALRELGLPPPVLIEAAPMLAPATAP